MLLFLLSYSSCTRELCGVRENARTPASGRVCVYIVICKGWREARVRANGRVFLCWRFSGGWEAGETASEKRMGRRTRRGIFISAGCIDCV